MFLFYSEDGEGENLGRRKEQEFTFLGCSLLKLVVEKMRTAGYVMAGFALWHVAMCEQTKPSRYHVASFNWEEVSLPFIIAIWIIVASVAKILFHIWPKISEMFPDSSLLIMVGLVIGIVLSILKVDRSQFYLGSQVFFLYLLPPLVFDAGFFMPARKFFDNLGSILAFALVGTTFNFVAMSLSLWAIGLTGVYGIEMPLLHCFIFGSLIVDVDPVAVIVIFEEMRINDDLFIAVFGESLLNDGVAVVFYKSMLTFAEIGGENLITQDYVLAPVSVLIVSFGGIGIGLLWAFFASFITKYTHNVKVLNPVFLLVCPYCAYLTAELFGLSSILSIVFCGATMRPFVRENISEKSFTSINYFVKVLSLASETAIFVFLGLSTVSSDHHWNSPFIIVTVVLCILYRTLGVTILCYFLNKGRLRKYSKVDQFILSYGGLRGAIAYGLVVALPDELPTKRMFVTACIVVIYWTVFLQGLTLRPVANFLEVERKKIYEKSMIEHVYQNLIDYTMLGMEDIAGTTGHYSLRDGFEKFTKRYLKPWLVKRERRKALEGSNILRAHQRIKRREAEDLIRGVPNASQNQLFIEAYNKVLRSRVQTMESSFPNGSLFPDTTTVDGGDYDTPNNLGVEALTRFDPLGLATDFDGNNPLQSDAISRVKNFHIRINEDN